MSHTVRFDFNRLAQDCYIVCDNTEDRIRGLESQLSYLDRLASEGLDTNTQKYVLSVQSKLDAMRQELNEVLSKAMEFDGLGQWVGDSDSVEWRSRFSLKDRAYDLRREVNRTVATFRPAVNGIIDCLKNKRRERIDQEKRERREAIQREIDERNRASEELRRQNAARLEAMMEANRQQQAQREASRSSRQQLDALVSQQTEERRRRAEETERQRLDLVRKGEENRRALDDLLSAQLAQQEKRSEVWESVEDANLRQFTYLAHLANPSLEGDALLTEGRRAYDETMARMRRKELEEEQRRARQELAAAKVSDAEIEKALTIEGTSDAERLEHLYASTSDAIVGETIRKKTLQIVRKAIVAQGFILDPKNIKKDGDVVTMVAQKAGGEMAKFTVFLDGKFIYDFNGYEGQACQKDIEPFMHDLRDVYGVELIEREEIWCNPDKILSQKRQVMNSDHKKL